MQEIINFTLSSDTTAVTLGSIPSTFNHLIIYGRLLDRSSGSAVGVSYYINNTVNSDHAYSMIYSYGQGAGGSNNWNSAFNDYGSAGVGGDSNENDTIQLIIPCYKESYSNEKAMFFSFASPNYGNTSYQYDSSGFIARKNLSGAAITNITFYIGNGYNFAAGKTKFTVYGV